MASLLVAVYHIWLGRVSGGVDVFFVVSAFLITTSLLRHAEAKGRIDFVAFWGNLQRRLLPTAMLVLVAVVVASFLWLPRTLWADTIQQLVASLLYLENWQLAFNAVDYLAQGLAASPVQHFWALSIQGQFYVLWPLLFIAALYVARRSGKPLRPVLALAFVAVFCLSFAWSVYATRHNQAFTYFNTFARLWEFSIGAGLALAPRFAAARPVRAAMGWVGLVGLVTCGLVFQVSRQFPGYAALWPVGCAALLILAGGGNGRWSADRLLSSRPLVWLGNLSYGLYLWHWPVLIFWRWFTDHPQFTLLEGSLVLGVSLLLSLATTRLVDDRIRDPARRGTARWPEVLRFNARTVAPVAVIIGCWFAFFAWQRTHHAGPLDPTRYPGALAWHDAAPRPVTPGVEPRPGMLVVQDDLPPIYDDGCYKPDPRWQRENCIYGDKSASRTLALVGGSHSVHWLPALDLVAKQTGWRIVVYTKSNCLFSEEIERIELDSWCEEWNQGTLELLMQDRPDVVFTTSTRGSGAEEHVPEGFLMRWETLAQAGIRVVAVRDTPWMKIWIPECLEMKGLESEECAKRRHDIYASSDPVHERVARRVPHVHFLDMSDLFCDAQRCPPVIGNVVVYRDDSHITATYSRSLAPILLERLMAGMPGHWSPSGQSGS